MKTSILSNRIAYKGYILSTYIHPELEARQESTLAYLNGVEVFGTFSLNFDSHAKMIAKIDSRIKAVR